MTTVARSPANEMLIAGMMGLLPPVGAEWPIQDRVRWLRAMGSILNVIYGASLSADEITVSIA